VNGQSIQLLQILGSGQKGKGMADYIWSYSLAEKDFFNFKDL